MSNSDLLQCLYPNKCAGCDEIIEPGRALCDYCAVKINNVKYDNVCPECGVEKDFCLCKSRAYHFKGVLGAYKNEGVARKAYYSYKMGRRDFLAGYFADRIARAVKTVFTGLEFDAVCCVPTARRSYFKRGFDHNGKIAAKLAENLGVPLLTDVLKARHLRPLQHRSSLSKRLANVRGKYYTVKRVNAERVLLFDDIFTTGATLDECAKELMFAGVRQVYCASVLITYPSKKQNGEK